MPAPGAPAEALPDDVKRALAALPEELRRVCVGALTGEGAEDGFMPFSDDPGTRVDLVVDTGRRVLTITQALPDGRTRENQAEWSDEEED